MSPAETCARCGAELEWHERKLVFWNKQLKDGYIKWYVIGSNDMGKRKEFPQYKGKKLCQICAHEVFTGKDYSTQRKRGHPPKGDITIGGDTSAISDFVGLKDFLIKNGIVMSVFNCPKCNNMVGIPDKGKLLICEHCGQPIKPNEIAEKIKSLT